MLNLGIVKPGRAIYVPFYTVDSNDPQASVTITGLAVTDIEIYKDGSTTQRASDSGYTLLDTDGIDFDSTTGIHGVSIDLADNTTAGFYSAGSQYMVVIASITVDAATINFIPVIFEIGYPDAVLNTTIATLSSQTSFTLTSGPAEDDALNGSIVLIHDVASAVQLGYGVVSDYTGSTKTVTLTAGTTFTAAATDNISFYPPANVSYVGATAQTANDNGQDLNTTISNQGTMINYLEQLSRNLVINDTLISSVSSQTEIVLTAGSADDDAYNGLPVVFIDASTSTQIAVGTCIDYTGSTKTLFLKEAPVFTISATDRVAILFDNALKPTTNNTQLDITANGNAGIDWNNIDNPTTAVDLSGTDIQLVDTCTTNTDMRGTDSAATAGDSMALTAAAIDAVWDEAAAGHLSAGTVGLASALGSAAIADGTMTGTPTTTEFTFTGGNTTDNFYNDQLVYILSGTGIGQVRPVITSAYSGGTTTITVDEAWVITPAASDRFAILVNHVHPKSQIADAVWDEATSGHSTAGTTGKALTDTLADTNEIQGDLADGGRLDLILDAILAMLDDPRAEPGQGAPAVNADAMTKLDYLYKAWRNKIEQTATTLSIYDDAGTTVDHKSTVSDDGTTATIGEIGTGP